MKHCSSCASVVFGDWTVSTGKFLSLFSVVNLHKEKDKMYLVKVTKADVMYMAYIMSKYCPVQCCVCNDLSASWIS